MDSEKVCSVAFISDGRPYKTPEDSLTSAHLRRVLHIFTLAPID